MTFHSITFSQSMNIRSAIANLIDYHGEELRMSRRQLADLAKVNPGQVSNWLRNDGAMGPEREGRVVEAMLECVNKAVKGSESEQALRRFRKYISVLENDSSLSSLKAQKVDPSDGAPISPRNDGWVHTGACVELQDYFRRDRFNAHIHGGPKSGKSSLFHFVRESLAPGRTAVSLDFSKYRPEPLTSPERAEKGLMVWIKDRVEEAVTDGPGNAALNSAADMPEWIENNILPRAYNGKAVFLIDGVSRLHQASWGENAGILVGKLAEALQRTTLVAIDRPALERFSSFVFLDPCDKSVTHTSFESPYQVGSVQITGRFTKDATEQLLHGRLHEHPETEDIDKVYNACSGQPYLSQVLCRAIGDGADFDAAFLAARSTLENSVRENWGDEQINFAKRLIESPETTHGLNDPHVLNMIHSGLFRHTFFEGGVKLSPTIRGFSLDSDKL